VYKKNRKFARTFLSLDPHIPIMKNIGSKMLSKKIKNKIKSVAENEQIRNTSKIKK